MKNVILYILIRIMHILKHFKKFKIHNFADCFMGFAVLFMGLDLLKNIKLIGNDLKFPISSIGSPSVIKSAALNGVQSDHFVVLFFLHSISLSSLFVILIFSNHFRSFRLIFQMNLQLL